MLGFFSYSCVRESRRVRIFVPFQMVKFNALKFVESLLFRSTPSSWGHMSSLGRTFFSKQKHQHFRYGLNILFQVASETECIPILNDKLLYKTCWDANKKTTPPFPDSLSHHQVDMIQILGIPQLEGAVTQLVPAATLAALVTSASLGGFKGDDSG